MSEFKGIPILLADSVRVESGAKYRKPQGFTSINDGIKAAAASHVVPLRKPSWLRAPMPAIRHWRAQD